MSTKVLVATLLGLALLGGSIYAWVLSTSVKAYEDANADKDRRICRANFQVIANALLAYRVRTGLMYTESLEDLQDDFGFEGGEPICPNGGKYSINVGEPVNAFTIHCSVRAHGVGSGREPSGYSPGMNSS